MGMDAERLAPVLVDLAHQVFVEETKLKVHLPERLRERLIVRMAESLKEVVCGNGNAD